MFINSSINLTFKYLYLGNGIPEKTNGENRGCSQEAAEAVYGVSQLQAGRL
jgi:hypothetical protein